jgi:hypothetical protein
MSVITEYCLFQFPSDRLYHAKGKAPVCCWTTAKLAQLLYKVQRLNSRTAEVNADF